MGNDKDMKGSYKDIQVILTLYDLRREEKLRAAREWYARKFFPQSAEDVLATLNPNNPDAVYFRMVVSYWEMAASFMTHGPLDEDLFFQSGGEMVFVWAKIVDFIPKLREQYGPAYLANIEQAIQRVPAAVERLKATREWLPKLREQVMQTASW